MVKVRTFWCATNASMGSKFQHNTETCGARDLLSEVKSTSQCGQLWYTPHSMQGTTLASMVSTTKQYMYAQECNTNGLPYVERHILLEDVLQMASSCQCAYSRSMPWIFRAEFQKLVHIHIQQYWVDPNCTRYECRIKYQVIHNPMG